VPWVNIHTHTHNIHMCKVGLFVDNEREIYILKLLCNTKLLFQTDYFNFALWYYISANAQVANVFKKPVQQSDRVENLQNCLHHLELHDVDTQGINGVDLADGNLKSTLILMNNLRKKYEVRACTHAHTVTQNKHTHTHTNKLTHITDWLAD